MLSSSSFSWGHAMEEGRVLKDQEAVQVNQLSMYSLEFVWTSEYLRSARSEGRTHLIEDKGAQLLELVWSLFIFIIIVCRHFSIGRVLGEKRSLGPLTCWEGIFEAENASFRVGTYSLIILEIFFQVGIFHLSKYSIIWKILEITWRTRPGEEDVFHHRILPEVVGSHLTLKHHS